MKVILKADVKGTGKKDQVVEVSDGYARNFLFPRKLAVEAGATQLNAIKKQQEAEAFHKQQAREKALAQSKELAGKQVTVAAKVGKEGGKLFGTVTSMEIAAALEQQLGLKVDKKKIRMDDHIKQLGETGIEVSLFEGVSVKLRVMVVAAP